MNMEFTITIPLVPFMTILTWYMLASIATSMLLFVIHATQALSGEAVEVDTSLLSRVMFVASVTVAWPLALVALYKR